MNRSKGKPLEPNLLFTPRDFSHCHRSGLQDQSKAFSLFWGEHRSRENPAWLFSETFLGRVFQYWLKGNPPQKHGWSSSPWGSTIFLPQGKGNPCVLLFGWAVLRSPAQSSLSVAKTKTETQPLNQPEKNTRPKKAEFKTGWLCKFSAPVFRDPDLQKAANLGARPKKRGSLHYTPEHCLVNRGFPFWC